MLLAELLELLRHGENSGVEFKRDDVHPVSLAREIAALANLEGGHILLGVEDDGTPLGLSRPPREAEEWLMNVCRDRLQPPLVPLWEVLEVGGATRIGVITIPADAPDKPYQARRGGSRQTFMRAGSTSREATRDEEARLYQSSGLPRYDIRPVPGTYLDSFNRLRLDGYFRAVRGQDAPALDDRAGWELLLINTELMVEDRGRAVPTVGGLLLFGTNPSRYLPQSGASAVAYPGDMKDCATRNELIKEVLRDYRYIEATGLGVPRKLIRGMREHNGTEPDLIEEETRFLARLWKTAPVR